MGSLVRPLVGLLIAFFAVGASGCDESKRSPPSEPPLEPDLPPRPDLDPDAAAAATLDDAGLSEKAKAEAQKVVADIRSQRLDVTPRRLPTQHLAFGKDRIAHLTEDALIVRDTSAGKEQSKLSVVEPRRIVTQSDGSLVVLAKNDVTRIDKKKTDRFSRIPLFVDSLVFADKRDKTKLWVLHGIDPTLYPYSMNEDGKLETLDLLQLAEFDQKGFAALKDGSFVYTAGKRLKRFFPGGKTWSLDLPEGGEVWRILTTKRIDEVWLARADGKLELAQISADRLSVVKTLEAPGAFDIASNDSELAILRLEKAENTRAWKLSVFDGAGKELWKTELPLDAVPGSGDSWVKEITKNRGLLLSAYGPFVAVGGPTELTIWNYKKGEKVFGS
jgi:hypothetical protein